MKLKINKTEGHKFYKFTKFCNNKFGGREILNGFEDLHNFTETECTSLNEHARS